MPIYMKVEGIPLTGSGKGKHKGWIELESAQLGATRNITSPTGMGVNRSNVPAEIVVTKLLDESSQILFRLSLWGDGKKITIEFTNSDSEDARLTFELENTLISSYNVSGHGGSASSRPMESLSLNFTKVTYKVAKAPDSKSLSPEKVGWDLIN
jgi:type VI secretion system secreted protein Hcp